MIVTGGRSPGVMSVRARSQRRQKAVGSFGPTTASEDEHRRPRGAQGKCTNSPLRSWPIVPYCSNSCVGNAESVVPCAE